MKSNQQPDNGYSVNVLLATDKAHTVLVLQK